VIILERFGIAIIRFIENQRQRKIWIVGKIAIVVDSQMSREYSMLGGHTAVTAAMPRQDCSLPLFIVLCCQGILNWGVYFLYFNRETTEESSRCCLMGLNYGLTKSFLSRETYHEYYKRILAAHQRQGLCD